MRNPQPKSGSRHREDGVCGCPECEESTPFALPQELLSECRTGRLALFAGAGISTEGARVLPQTFYVDICQDLGLNPKTAGPFADVMSAFTARPNGRRLLLQRLQKRLQYVDSFEELRSSATRFHRELSTLHIVDTIVTTNWDDYFERECGARPFVTAEDFALWDTPGRKVFKIHGSVNNYGSLVATRADYDICYERLKSGLLGATLKHMLATRTFVYVGFAFSDEDFVRLHALLSDEMKGLHPQSYIVTLDRASDARFREHGLIPIYADGARFLRAVKAILVRDKVMLSDRVYLGIDPLIRKLTSLHLQVAELDARRYPEVIYTLCYQDGLKHALTRILTLQHTGYYSHVCNPRDAFLDYEERRKIALRQHEFVEAAYLDGYMNGLVAFLAEPPMRRAVPMFFFHGREEPVTSLHQFKRLLSRAGAFSKAASAAARRLVRERGSRDLVIHHPPWLVGERA